MNRNTPRTEFAQAIQALVNQKGLTADVIIDAIKHAIVAAYKKDAKERGEEVEELLYDVEIDPVTGESKVFMWEEGKEDKKKDVTPPGFGRIAAQTAKQVIHQKIREAEKSTVLKSFEEKIGSLVSGNILRFEGSSVRVDIGRTEGIMLQEERIPNERLNSGQRLTFLLKGIEETPKGAEIILSRADNNFIIKLFEREVPEIGSGSVVIQDVAREPGVRTKIAVVSTQAGVDPVGSCVGQRGVRVQAVTKELGEEERIDIVAYNEDPEEFIKAALAPAEGLIVKLNKKEKTAVVTTSEDQLSQAIGREGQNARLAGVLTGWEIKVESDGTIRDQVDQTVQADDVRQEKTIDKEVMPPKPTEEGKEEQKVTNISDAKEVVELDIKEAEKSANEGKPKDSAEQNDSDSENSDK